jgi:hypothetical protein
MPNPLSQVAGGDIRPARFVKLSTAADFTILEADANDRPYGISIDAYQHAPIPSNTGGLAASAGESLRVYGLGDECTLTLGSGGATRGDMLKSDNDGKGVVAATTGTTVQWVGAEALESGLENEKIKVRVVLLAHRPALS